MLPILKEFQIVLGIVSPIFEIFVNYRVPSLGGIFWFVYYENYTVVSESLFKVPKLDASNMNKVEATRSRSRNAIDRGNLKIAQ